jgi:hypothetical protein
MQILTFPLSIHPILLVGSLLLGCNQIRESNKICLVGSRDRDTAKGAGALQSILFIEDQGALFAKLLQCGDKEYYLGSYAMSNSTAALGVEYFRALDSSTWDKLLSCSDAVSAFPYNEKNTTDLLKSMCTGPFLKELAQKLPHN